MEYFALVKEIRGIHLVSFPDFPYVHAYGPNLEQALRNGRKALNETLESEFEWSCELPRPKRNAGRKDFHSVTLFPHVALAYQLRKLRKKSQIDVARRLGISHLAYRRLEDPRKCNPTVKTLERFESVLGIKLTISLG